ncbi:MAG: IS4 family transposase [Flavobacteriales bacterium]|nr:IS4 family transposase [Flavobacteriales bacterium]MCB9251850.1 IS4 family transposase [Flavobacteriales bacterium]MCB9252427.1 IS4 family transposase [Flavobacteriales bacterium]
MLKLIPEDELEFLSVTTDVNYQTKKLYGSVIFKLLLFSMLNSSKVSYRVMEKIVLSSSFIAFLGFKIETKFNSIRDRICCINASYFEQLFNKIFTIYNQQLKEEKALIKVDSTYVGIASKLVKWDMHNGRKNTSKKQIKYSVSVKGSLPCGFKIFTDKKYISEDLALSETITENIHIDESLVVFDRGLKSRKKFDELTNQSIHFITRIAPNTFLKIIENNRLYRPIETQTLIINEDLKVKLRNRSSKISDNNYRVIKAKMKSSNEPLIFLTNDFDLSADEVTTLYKQRWEIELFFKFLKQHLNLSHLVSRNENAIKVILYMTMILAILILSYRKINNIKGYKMAKLQFEIELDNSMIKEIVILSGGNPDKVSYLWNTS